jgi:hypothetical protein
MKTPVFSMPLTDDERQALDRVRANRGLKSAADAIRKLIEENDPERVLPSIWGPEPLPKPVIYDLGKRTSPAKPLSSMTGKPNPKGKGKS